MLNRASRIDSKEFSILKNGVTIRTPLFNAKKYHGPSKLAIIISKKNLKKSNKRNALRRKICYAYRQQAAKNLNSGTLVLNYIYKSIDQELPTYSDIQKQITQICGTQS